MISIEKLNIWTNYFEQKKNKYIYTAAKIKNLPSRLDHGLDWLGLARQFDKYSNSQKDFHFFRTCEVTKWSTIDLSKEQTIEF